MLLLCKNKFNGIDINEYREVKINYNDNYAYISFKNGNKIPLSLIKDQSIFYLYDYFYEKHEERLLKINKIKEVCSKKVKKLSV